MNSYIHLVSPRFFIQTSSLHTIASANLKHLSYLAYFRLSGSKTSPSSMNTTWPKSPWFYVLVFRSAAAKALCNSKLEEAWIVDKKLNSLFVCIFGGESSQKSVMIFKMLLYLKAYSLWGLDLRFLSNWSREAVFLRNFLDKYIILVPIEENKECLRFKLGFRFFARWDPHTCSV